MVPYHTLTAKGKRLTNEYLNNYIRHSLNTPDWEEVLQRDFNELCNEEIFDDSFGEKADYTNLAVRQVNTEPVLMVKEEHEA